MENQTFRIVWRGIEIEATYTPLRWKVIEHLEIRSVKPKGAKLPITSTGYLSHFMQLGTITAHGGDVIAQVVAWLEEEATKPDWMAHTESQRQGDLFD